MATASASASRRRTTSTAASRRGGVVQNAERGSVIKLEDLATNVDRLRQECQSTFSSTRSINEESMNTAKDLKKQLGELKDGMSQQYRTGFNKKFHKALQKLPGRLGEHFTPESVRLRLDQMCKFATTVFDAQVDQYHELEGQTDTLYSQIIKLAEDHRATTADLVLMLKDVKVLKKDLDKATENMAKYDGKDEAKFSEAQLQHADIKAELAQVSREVRVAQKVLQQLKSAKGQFEEFAEIMEKVLQDNADILQLAHTSLQGVLIGAPAAGALIDALNGIEDLKRAITTADDAVTGVMKLAAASASVDRLTELSEHLENNSLETRAAFKPVIELREAEKELFIAQAIELADKLEAQPTVLQNDKDMFVTKDVAAKGARGRPSKNRLPNAPDMYKA